MKISFPHGTTRARALEVLQAKTPELMARFGSGLSDLQEAWQANELSFSFKAGGIAITGMLSVDDEQMELDLNLPQLARLMEGQIHARVKNVMHDIFEPENHAKEHLP